MFLNFQKFEPQRSYKHGSYKKRGVEEAVWKLEGLRVTLHGSRWKANQSHPR